MNNNEKLSLFRKGNTDSIGLTDVPLKRAGDKLYNLFIKFEPNKQGVNAYRIYGYAGSSNTPETTCGQDTSRIIDDCEEDPDTIPPLAGY